MTKFIFWHTVGAPFGSGYIVVPAVIYLIYDNMLTARKLQQVAV